MRICSTDDEDSAGLTMVSSQGPLTAESSKANLDRQLEGLELRVLLDGLKAIWKGNIDGLDKMASIDYLRGVFDGCDHEKKTCLALIQATIRVSRHVASQISPVTTSTAIEYGNKSRQTTY